MSVSQVDESIISCAIRYPQSFKKLRRAGITADLLWDEYKPAWTYITRMHDQYGQVPSRKVFQARYPDVDLPKIKESDMALLIHNARARALFTEFLDSLSDAGQAINSWDDVEDVAVRLQGKINTMLSRTSKNKEGPRIVNLFSDKVKKQMIKELKRRRDGAVVGIPTGLTKFDNKFSGLTPETMTVIIGRPGQGKSWVDLLFVKTAVMNHKKVLLYPLEMSLAETAFRLYTLFTAGMFGVSKALKNTDLNMGHISIKRVVKFLNILEKEFNGLLYVADTASLGDLYTIERIETDVQVYKPDLFWIDYLTLMKTSGGDAHWESVRQLSNGIKNIAIRNRCVGGCTAQVNRQGILTTGGENPNKVLLPRLEHIAYGDSIGQDADKVFSLAGRKDRLYWALVKNRNGPEIGRTKMKFYVDNGLMEEIVDE